MITFYEKNQLTGRGLNGAPEDGVMPLPTAADPEPMPPLDKKALGDAQAATAVLVRQGKVSEPYEPHPDVDFTRLRDGEAA